MSRISLLGLIAALGAAACGSNKASQDTATKPASDAGGGSTPTISSRSLASSKMAQQSMVSTQNQADQSETATAGSDDGSGTGKTARQPRGGSLGITLGGSVAFNAPLMTDANVVLDFNAYVDPRGTRSGSVLAHVRPDMQGNYNIVITGSLQEDRGGNHVVHESTNPNIEVVKMGNRGNGRVQRSIRGAVHRAMALAEDGNDSFDFIISHTNTLVTDLYANSVLTKRSVTGTINVLDNSDGASAAITFADVVRSSPSSCLCPESGSITVQLVGKAFTESMTHTFGSTCGQVHVTGTVAATVAASADASTATAATAGAPAGTSSGTASAGTSASSAASATQTIDETVTWDFCQPESD